MQMHNLNVINKVYGQELLHESIYQDSYETWLSKQVNIPEEEIAEKGFTHNYYEKMLKALDVKVIPCKKGEYYDFYAIHYKVDYRLLLSNGKEIWLKVCKDKSQYNYWINRNIDSLGVVLASRISLRENIQALSQMLDLELTKEYRSLLNLWNQLRGKFQNSTLQLKVNTLKKGNLRNIWKKMCDYNFFILEGEIVRVV